MSGNDQSLLGGAQNTGKGVTDTVGGALGGVTNTLGDTVGGVGKGVGDTLGSTTEGVGNVTKGVGDTAKGGVNQGGEALGAKKS